MAAVVEHQCNPRKSDKNEAPRLFRNDANSVSELQRARAQKRLAEEAARLQQEKLDAANQDIKSIREERDRLREALEGMKRTLDEKNDKCKSMGEDLLRLDNEKKQKERELETALSQKQAVETLKAQKEAELATANTDKSNYNQQVNSISATVYQQSVELQSLRSKVTSMENMLPNSRQDNCLPFQYHNSTVLIVNLGSQRAIDAGKDNGVLAHGWDYDVNNASQIFTLTKIRSNADQNDPWVIARKHDGKRLYFGKSDTGIDLQVGNAPGQQDFWFIGRGSDSRVGSWVIKNAEWGTCIELQSSSRSNGTRILSYSFSNHSDGNWVIIPIAFTS